jgi:hypothetical protein
MRENLEWSPKPSGSGAWWADRFRRNRQARKKRPLVRVSTREAAAHFVCERTRWGFQYSQPKTEEVIPEVPVRIWSGELGDALPGAESHYDSGDRNYGIHVTVAPIDVGEADQKSYAFDERVVLHEYGHHIHHVVGAYDSEGAPRGFFERSNSPKQAFAEGWATYFALAVIDAYDPVVSEEMRDPTGGNFMRRIEYLPMRWWGRHRVTPYSRFDGDGEAYEAVVAALLWDLHDRGDTGEPFDNETNPHAVFRAMDLAETRDPITGLARVRLDHFIDQYTRFDGDGDRQTLANLCSYYGVWEEEQSGNYYQWNGVRWRADRHFRPLRSQGADGGIQETISLHGVIQRMQSDWYAVKPREVTASSRIVLEAALDHVEEDFGFAELLQAPVRVTLWRGQQRVGTVSLGPGFQREVIELPGLQLQPREVLHLEVHSLGGLWGDYSVSVTWVE